MRFKTKILNLQEQDNVDLNLFSPTGDNSETL